MTYNPVTGYVERISRIGSGLQELRQATDSAEPVGAEIADEGDGEATPEERHELNLLARSVGVGWGVDDAVLQVYGVTLAIGGLALIALPFVLLVLAGSYLPSPTSGAVPTLLYFALLGGAVFIPAAVLLSWDARIVGEWVRRVYAPALPPLTVEGTQVCWTHYWDWYTKGYESLAAVQLQNGEQLLFRIPGYWAHRVRRANDHVRVTYNEQTWRVLDYRPLPPVSA